MRVILVPYLLTSFELNTLVFTHNDHDIGWQHLF